MKITLKIHPVTEADVALLAKALALLATGSMVVESKKPAPLAPKVEAPPAETKIIVETVSADKTVVIDETITPASLRALVQEKMQAGFSADLRKILDGFGAKNTSAVKPEDYVSFKNQLTNLK